VGSFLHYNNKHHFCSQKCRQRYEEKNNRDIEITGVEQSKKGGVTPKGTHTCSVCSKVNTMKHQVQLEGKTFTKFLTFYEFVTTTL
jgi:predicted nucleic acid-binding Zn ribbon protein